MTEKGRVCVVTSAAGGIGAAVAKKFYTNGYEIVMADIEKDKAQQVLRREGMEENRVSCYGLDISSEEQVRDVIREIRRTKGRIDALINAAGITGKYDTTIDYSFENFKKIYSVNVFGTFLMMHYALPLMMEQNYGRIVNFGSVSGMTGYTFEIGYGSSKWAVIGMTKNVANEYGKDISWNG